MTTYRGPGPHSPAILAFILLLTTAPFAAGAVRNVPGSYPTIQAAVNAAQPGDEIVVAAGTYAEQVVIGKNLTLTGAGQGETVILAPFFMPFTTHQAAYNAVIHLARPATSVTIRDLTVDGAHRGRDDTRFTGIMYDRVGGLCERIEISRLGEAPGSTAVSGIGLYTFSESGDGLEFTARDVLIRDFQKAGYACFGGGCVQHLERVTADLSGVYSDAVANGFELLLGTQGSLKDCTARRCWYDGEPLPGVTSCGFILYYSNGWTFEDCRSDENQTGIYSIATSLVVNGGEIDVYPDLLEFNHGIAMTSSPYARKGQDDLGLGLPRTVAESEPATEFPDAFYVFELRDSNVRGRQLPTRAGSPATPTSTSCGRPSRTRPSATGTAAFASSRRPAAAFAPRRGRAVSSSAARSPPSRRPRRPSMRGATTGAIPAAPTTRSPIPAASAAR